MATNSSYCLATYVVNRFYIANKIQDVNQVVSFFIPHITHIMNMTCHRDHRTTESTVESRWASALHLSLDGCTCWVYFEEAPPPTDSQQAFGNCRRRRIEDHKAPAEGIYVVMGSRGHVSAAEME